MKNIKYFLTLGIVLISSAIIITGCGKKDNKEETTTINILGSSAKATDEKNAEEIAVQLQNCISHYESIYATKSVPYVIPDNGDDIIIEWKKDKSCDIKSENEAFNEIVKSAFKDFYCESKVKKGNYAKATISLCDPEERELGYTIEVTLGNAVNNYNKKTPEEIDEQHAEKLVDFIWDSINSYEQTDFFTNKEKDFLIPANGDDITIKWTGKNITDNDIQNERFKEIIESTTTDYMVESKVKNGTYAKATISLRDPQDSEYGYKIIVELGNSTANFPNY